MYVCHESGIAGDKWDICTGLESGEDGVSEIECCRAQNEKCGGYEKRMSEHKARIHKTREKRGTKAKTDSA